MLIWSGIELHQIVSLCMQTRKPDTLYRVSVCNDTKQVQVLQIALEPIDTQIDETYGNVDQLPIWMQEGLAILTMTPHEPPTKEITGVGRRIDEHTYWLHG